MLEGLQLPLYSATVQMQSLPLPSPDPAAICYIDRHVALQNRASDLTRLFLPELGDEIRRNIVDQPTHFS